MLEDLTADSVFSQVLMEEPPPRAFLLVEGPDEDAVFFEHLSEGVARIIAGGKKAVLGAAQLALDTGMANVFGLVDRDLDSLRGRDIYPVNVVATDSYDLIADLLAVLGDSALRRAMSAHATSSVRIVESATNRHIVDIVYDLTAPLVAVRLAALESHYPLVLKNYDFRTVVNANFEAADVSSYVHNAVCRRPDFVIDAAVIDTVRGHMAMGAPRQHSGGHDLVGASVAILAAGGTQVTKKAMAGNIISFATCEVLASISCLQSLNSMARRETGNNLIECVAA